MAVDILLLFGAKDGNAQPDPAFLEAGKRPNNWSSSANSWLRRGAYVLSQKLPKNTYYSTLAKAIISLPQRDYEQQLKIEANCPKH
jgi:hypothetical protein